MADSRNACVDMLLELEALAPANADLLHAGRFGNPETGHATLGLKNQAGDWVLAFADDATLDQAGYMAALYNHSHTLITLARMGLEAAGVMPADPGTCRRCHSFDVEITRKAAGGREVLDIVCLQCGNAVTQLVPSRDFVTADGEAELV